MLDIEQRARKRLGQQQAEASDMPQILDYVGQKAEMYELHDNLRNWEREVEIMEMAAKRRCRSRSEQGLVGARRGLEALLQWVSELAR